MAVELATAYVSLVPSARGFGRKVSDEIDGEVDESSRRAGKRSGESFSGGFGSSLKGAVGVAAGAFAALQVGQFAAGAISAASDLNESISKTGVIFGDSSSAIEQWASTAAKSIGQSKVQALDAASTFATFGKSAGLTGQSLVDFSTKNAQLASDLASFNNTSPEEAIEAIGAALRGEAEPIRKYGVLLDDATLRQRALALGLIKTTKEALTPQQKVLAANAEIYAQTGAAQGDFARTSDGLANRQRILAAQFTDLKGRLGTGLLPAVNAVAGFLVNGLIPAFEKIGRVVGPVLSELRGGIFAFAAAFKAGGDDITSNGLPGFLERVGLIARRVFDWIKANVPPVLAALSAGFQRFAAWAEVHLLPLWEKLRSALASAFGAIHAVVSTVVTVVLDLWARFGDGLLSGLLGALNGILKALGGVFDIIGGLFDLIKAVLTGKWGEAWDAIKQILGGVVTVIVGLVQGLWSTLVGLFDVFRGTLSAAWALLWHGLHTLVTDTLGRLLAFIGQKLIEVGKWFVGLHAEMLNALISLPGKMLDIGGDIIRGLLDGLKAGWAKVTGWLNDAASKLPGIAKKVLGISSPSKVFAGIGSNITDGLALGIRRGAADAADALGGVASTLAGARFGPAGLYASAPAPIPGTAAGVGGVNVMVTNPAPRPKEIGDAVAFAMLTAGR